MAADQEWGRALAISEAQQRGAARIIPNRSGPTTDSS